MSPSAFTFKVSVPNDPKLASVIGELAKHAADYAKLEAAAASAFAERARTLAATMLGAGTGTATTAVIAAANGQLTVTMGGQSAAHALAKP